MCSSDLAQPDLGTAMMLTLAAAAVMFLAGVRVWVFIAVAAAAGGVLPIAFEHLKEYQKKRITSFLNPESDPLGAGYHIIQSTIAIGSGGIFGKGWLEGTQSQLDFIPERSTDFILAVFAEEFGLVGVLLLKIGRAHV